MTDGKARHIEASLESISAELDRKVAETIAATEKEFADLRRRLDMLQAQLAAVVAESQVLT